MLRLSRRWNIAVQPKYTVSALVILVLIIFLITTPSFIQWLWLNNNKYAYAAAITASVGVNGRTLYVTAASARSTNKLTTAAVGTVPPSAPLPSKALPSLTRSLSSIITKIKEGNNNRNNLTKSPHSSFPLDMDHHISSKTMSATSSDFEVAAHNAVKLNDKQINIAFIKPSFTAAAYDHSYYVFYTLYQNTLPRKNVTTDLNLLTGKVTTHTTDSSPSAFAMFHLSKNIKSLIPKSKIAMLTDVDVDAGKIFTSKNKSNKYNILIIGHQEYVTQQEYNNLKQFVRSGGTMIILDGNIFYAEVKYDRNTQTVTLVKGHGWAFNGISAWKSVSERWKEETSEWVGSNYLCYGCSIIFDNDPFEYKHHEEQYITNPNDVILFNYGASIPSHNKPSLKPSSLHSLLASTGDAGGDISTKRIIATYELSYQKGKVIALGIYADDIITNNIFDKYFDNLLLRYAM
jgi:hypothetical protein